jgi:pyruvate/2-oxoglutarate dehydrogenase complex dihydrolipoamide dehydrogenase (E3) component
MAREETYDAIVIGAGQAGGPLASALARAGHKTAIVERAHVGGCCINEGCTPTKTMVASARDAYLVRRAADYGVHAGDGPVSVDMKVVRQRKRDIVEEFRTGSEKSLIGTEGVTLLMGEAHFTAPHTVEVRLNDGGETRALTAERVFVNTGERPAMPGLPGLEAVHALDSTSIMELDTVPEHLLIIGGGYIALEYGQMFRRFGSRVTIVQRGPQLLAREDRDIADAVAAILREDGIEVLLESAAQRVEQGIGIGAGVGGEVRLVVRSTEGERTLTGSHLLVATGRTPNTDGLDLAAAGLAANERGYIQVNERLETNVPGVWAMGDVKGPPAFTHISYDDYRILKANLLDGGHRTTRDRPVPYTVFIDPQLGRVGLSENEARAQGKKVRVASMPMSHVARAIETAEPRGLMKALVDGESDQILGCAILGLEGGEMMAMLQIAMMGGLPYTALRDGVFAHPTLAESFNNLFASL